MENYKGILKKEALEYLKRGFSVIPIGLGKEGKFKQSLVKWKEFQTRLPTEEEINEWFNKFRDIKGIAIVTGKISGLLVLDIEKDIDYKNLDLPYTPKIKTGGGGVHFYMKYPEETIGNFTGFRQKMDIRAEGGYIIAPPSKHHSGGMYEFEIDFENASLANVPEWLLTELKGLNKSKNDSVGKISVGNRNNAATKFIGSLLTTTPHEEWESKAWTALQEWNDEIPSPLNGNELRSIFDSIASRELKKDKASMRLEDLNSILLSIPSETSPTAMSQAVGPLFEKLCGLDDLTVRNFLYSDFKKHFGIKTKSDIELYIKHFYFFKKKFQSKRKNHIQKNTSIPLITDRDINSEEVWESISKVGIISREIVDIVLATCISSKLRLQPPIWLLIIGVPSSFKTELVNMLELLDPEVVYLLDTMSENAFASGYLPADGSEPKDLLPQLDNKCFIVKDLTTIFSLNEETVKKLLGDLTSIFDVKFRKFTATRGNISYNSSFSMIGCITPAILNKHHNYVNQLGSRYCFIKIDKLDEESQKRGFEIAWNEKDRKTMLNEAKQLVSSFCFQQIKKIKKIGNLPDYVVDPEIKKWINSAAEFMAKGRGIIITRPSTFQNNQGKEITYYEVLDLQVEDPWRALQQIRSLIKILTFIRNKEKPTRDELITLKPLILSSMQVDRAEIIKALLNSAGKTRIEISNIVNKSAKTVGRTLKELEALNLIDSFKESEGPAEKQAARYFIKDLYSELFAIDKDTSPEFMSLTKEGEENKWE